MNADTLLPKGTWVVTDFQSICNAVNIPIGEKAEPKSFIIIIVGKLGKPVKGRLPPLARE